MCGVLVWGYLEPGFGGKYDPLARQRRGERSGVCSSRNLPTVLAIRERKGLDFLQEISTISIYSFCESDWEAYVCEMPRINDSDLS